MTVKLSEKLSLPPIIAALAVVLIQSACNPVRRVPDDQFLLQSNQIVDPPADIEKQDLEVFLKQRPNRKMLFWRTYLFIYNSVNIERMNRAKERKNARTETINNRRIEKNNALNKKRQAKGLPAKKARLKKKNRLTRREFFLSVGEPPVLFDSILTARSARQIKLFLINKGYFHATVKDSVIRKNKRATVHYLIQAGQPYTVRNISYEVKDEHLQYYVLSDASSCLIRRDQTYDVDRLQNERSRITDMLRNDGFYDFSKEYIYYEVDSSAGNRQVDLTIGIKNRLVRPEAHPDTVVEVTHNRYYIRNVYVYTDYDPRLKTAPSDTFVDNDYHLLYSGEMRYKPRLITGSLFISKGELFQAHHADQTYRRLTELKLFRSVQILFQAAGREQLDCFIYLSNIPRQSISMETEGTNTSGTLGIAGNLVYQNKNTFKGGEIFEVRLKGALEVQKTRVRDENQILTSIESPIPFNTLEAGTEVNYYIPRFLTPFRIAGSKGNNAKTNITSNYNFQRRPDFGRSVGNAAFGYSWKETATKFHLFNPLEFNLVNIFQESPELLQTINDSKDLFLKNSYSDHFTLGSRYGFVFTNQDIRKQKNFSYLRVGAESAGNLMRWASKLIDQYITPLPYYGGSFTIRDIPFSQYLRFDFDYRYYKLVNDKDKIVYRAAFGIGKPLHNLRVLPLEKSFFAGGPNSVRAWVSRTLGPGGYHDTTGTNYADKIGDAKVEANFEYRFNVIRIFNAALFLDAGNVWLRKKYDAFPDGEFNGEKFLGQIALGTGLGIRVDFNFFIIRLDCGIKLKDPSRPEKDRWMFGHQPLNDPVFNFGIGYPF